MSDASLSNVEERIVVKHALVDASDRRESNVSQCSSECGESFIPTAIVKPKYQKLSFDERQLPVCGSSAEEALQSPTNISSTTITSTPRKIQKHLPKSTQKLFAKQTRKLAGKEVECRVDCEVSDKESISHSEKDIDCCVSQNSIAIVQPLKKAIDANASVNSGDEKNQKPIDSSKNSFIMSHKHEQKSRNSSRIIAANVFAPRMSECGVSSVNSSTRKVADVERVCERKVPTTSKKQEKENSGEKLLTFSFFWHENGCQTNASKTDAKHFRRLYSAS